MSSTLYSEAALAQVPRLLSLLDREPYSPTFGCFDRDHWAWKFRDHPLGMMQSGAYALALLWKHELPGNNYRGNDRLLEWIAGALTWTIEQQRANGAFDVFSPNEQNPGPTLGVTHAITETYRLVHDALTPQLRERVRRCVRTACVFARHREEDHAFVSNHWALFAVAFHAAGELLELSDFAAAADQVIDRILREQSPDGWYREYDGPDPGYESLGIFHLAVYWRRTRSAQVLESLRRSIEFYAHCVHPDGSVGGTYAARQTRLYFPAGFEILAPEVRLAGAIAQFMRARLARHNVLTPASTDAENLPSLLYTYLEAALAAGDRTHTESLPCQTLQGHRDFTDAAITVAGTPHYYALVNSRKGGVLRVHERPNGQLAYEDAGYLVRAKGRLWSSMVLGLGRREQAQSGKEVALTQTLAELRVELLTPAKFLVLRLLNLTVFRSIAAGRWIRRRVVARLITGRRAGPFRLERTIRFGSAEIHLHDRLVSEKQCKVDEVLAPRLFTGLHMGSAKYFHDSDLTALPAPSTARMAETLNRHSQVERIFRLGFQSGGRPELTTSAPSSEVIATPAVR